jgi:hypothetical protein
VKVTGKEALMYVFVALLIGVVLGFAVGGGFNVVQSCQPDVPLIQLPLWVSNITYSGSYANFTMSVKITANESMPRILEIVGFTFPKGGSFYEHFNDSRNNVQTCTPIQLSEGDDLTIRWTGTGITLGHSFPFYILFCFKDSHIVVAKQTMYAIAGGW